MTFVPDPAKIDRLVLKIEETIHRPVVKHSRWDKPSFLYLLYDATDQETEAWYRKFMVRMFGPPIRSEGYAAQMAAPVEAINNGNPAHSLFRMARNMANPDPRYAWMNDEILVGLRAPAFLGMAFVYEGWGRSYNSMEERQAEGDVRFVDMPGSKEFRNVIAVDISQTGSCMAVRERGQKPYLIREGVDGFTDHGGALVESLRLITAVVADLPRPALTVKPTGFRFEDQIGPDDLPEEIREAMQRPRGG